MPFENEREAAASQDKKLMVNKMRCPKNHPCPAVRVCPTKALSQTGYAAPAVDDQEMQGEATYRLFKFRLKVASLYQLRKMRQFLPNARAVAFIE